MIEIKEMFGLRHMLGRMWPYFPDLLAANIPRYTSYPTAAAFGDGGGLPVMSASLKGVAREEALSVYVHIPYCKSICWYCGCNTGAASCKSRLAAYLSALEAEIALVAERLSGNGMVRRIAFGGGSPNAIAPVEFVRLVDRLLTILPGAHGMAPQISVEIDPRCFDAEWAATLEHCGVSRVSLGVQSLSGSIQQAIGRIQPFAMVEDCVAQLRAVGIDAINFDLMYGLPDQSIDDLLTTIDLAAKLQPSRVALFGYAHMPQLMPRQRRIDAGALPGLQARFAMAECGYRAFVGHGYVPVGFDHFARPGDSLAIAVRETRVHRNFQGFTDDECTTLIGLGASAISQFPGAIVQNAKSPGVYRQRVETGTLPAERTIVLSGEDRMRGALIESLLCNGATGPLPLGLLREARDRLALHVKRGLVTIGGDRVMLTPSGLPYARAVAAVFDGYRVPGGGQFSMAV